MDCRHSSTEGMRILTPFAMALLLLACMPAQAADAKRGELLTEVCLQCHSEQVFTRKDSTIDSMVKLRAEIRRWGAHSKPPMTREDIADLVVYLNARYYHFKP